MGNLDTESLPTVHKTISRTSVTKNGVELVESPASLAVVPRDEEVRMLRKFDRLLLPPLAFLFLMNALDRGNVANAKTDGWDKDIGLVGNQYYLLVMIFYVPFCLFGTPISLLVKRFSAARVLPLMMIGFGSMALCTAAARGFSQVLAIRWFLGMSESAVLPSVVFYLSTFYKRNELASRIGVFYAASTISGAFSGLIAYGAFHIKSNKYYAWQYLFWIEGAGTISFAIFAWFWLPKSPAGWWVLTLREKELARIRIMSDSSLEVNEKLNIRDSFRSFKDWRYGVWLMISFSLGVPLASVTSFMPQIITSLGYSTIKTNLYTVAPNVAATVALLILTFSSDHFRERSIHITIPLLTAIVGFVILGCINPIQRKGIAYFACFLLAMGAFSPSVLVASWYSNNTLSENRRVVVAAVNIAVCNSAGLVSANVFRAQDEPRYLPALITSACFGSLCVLLVIGMGLYMRIENARRNREQGVNLTSADVLTAELKDGYDAPEFRFIY